MKSFVQQLLAASALTGATLAAPTNANPDNKPQVVHPIPASQINASNLRITALNTINATTPDTRATPNAGLSLPISFVNNLDSDNLKFYISTHDSNGNPVFVKADGSFYSLPDGTGVELDQDSIAHSISGKGSTTNFTISTQLPSSRVYVSDGALHFFSNGVASLVTPSVDDPNDPNAKINYGYAEFNYAADGSLNGNLSYIDFVGLIIGALFKTDKATTTVKGLPADGVSQLCSKLQDQGNQDGQPWGKLCQSDDSGNMIRVVNPEHVQADWDAYWGDYVNQVWSKYSSEDMTINTQNDVGDIKGRVGSNGNLTFADYPSLTFGKPTAGDIWGCNSGPFANPDCDAGTDKTCRAQKAILARLCAAFDRTTWLVDNGATQPNGPSDSTYYSNTPTNQFSKFVHQLEIDGKGYAFAYDDVHADGGKDQAGTWAAGAGDTIDTMTFTLGGDSS